ncbi:hypothetical protein DTO282F9_84 [Paecilomyces variotii]|nr:hypothetical protein DTO282F9_84 [Paecilomyces variotii]
MADTNGLLWWLHTSGTNVSARASNDSLPPRWEGGDAFGASLLEGLLDQIIISSTKAFTGFGFGLDAAGHRKIKRSPCFGQSESCFQ